MMAQRARRLFQNIPPGRGAAFLSFTQAAVFALGTRLALDRLIRSPVFPSFVGTFDSFVWQFLVAPFGVKGSPARPRLVPDIPNLMITPFPRAHSLPLSSFCPDTGVIQAREARRHGFDVASKPPELLGRYTAAAARTRAALRDRGKLSFDESRIAALERLKDSSVSERIATALSHRFVEIIVDEAQDCNSDDLRILSWLKDSGIPTKVVCDPNQSIYSFRGGVTDELLNFAARFRDTERKALTGNFRSTSNICMAIAQLRPPSERGEPDDALGAMADNATTIRILSYQGRVSGAIGKVYCSLLKQEDIALSSSPIVAATRDTGASAAGQTQPAKVRDRCIRVAEGVLGFHFATEFGEMRNALELVHQVLLEIEDKLGDGSYHQYLVDNEIEPTSWRSKVISIVRALDPDKHVDARAWHDAAKELLSSQLRIRSGRSIAQEFKWNGALCTLLSGIPGEKASPRTIHSVKGMEYPAVCVVTTASTLGGILDFLENGEPRDMAEEARKLYVAASRAQKLLVIAAPRSQAKRLRDHLCGQGAAVRITVV